MEDSSEGREHIDNSSVRDIQVIYSILKVCRSPRMLGIDPHVLYWNRTYNIEMFYRIYGCE